MLPDRVSNPGPPIYESGALPIALLAIRELSFKVYINDNPGLTLTFLWQGQFWSGRLLNGKR